MRSGDAPRLGGTPAWQRVVWVLVLLSAIVELVRLPRCGLLDDDDELVVTTTWRTRRIPWITVEKAELRPSRPLPGGHEIVLVTTAGERIRTRVVEGGDAAHVRDVVAGMNARRAAIPG